MPTMVCLGEADARALVLYLEAMGRWLADLDKLC
jgi:hypothetical protein